MECPYEVRYLHHFCTARRAAFNGFDPVKIGLHLEKLGRFKNLVDFPPQKAPFCSAHDVGHLHHFCQSRCRAFNGFDRAKIGLHLAKLGRIKNLVDFPPQKLPFGVPRESPAQHKFVPLAEVS